MASSGPRSPSTAASDAAIGTEAWSNPTNVTASDNTRATSGIDATKASQALKATGFGFAIPTGAAIDGIVVEWERCRSAGTGTIVDNASRVVKGSTIQATDRSSGTSWPSSTASEAYASYGGATDLWGTTWTPADINAAGFGAALSGICSAGSATAAVDHVRITVYYSEGQPTALRQSQTRTGAARIGRGI